MVLAFVDDDNVVDDIFNFAVCDPKEERKLDKKSFCFKFKLLTNDFIVKLGKCNGEDEKVSEVYEIFFPQCDWGEISQGMSNRKRKSFIQSKLILMEL